MDSGVTIIGLAFLLLGAVPIILLSRHKSNKKKLLLNELDNLAQQLNGKIDEYDFWKTMSIGIDKSNNSLYFIQKRELEIVKRHVNMQEISQCRAINKSNVISNKDSNYTVVEQLGLAFTFIDKTKSDLIFEFYNIDFDGFTVTNEASLIEKWAAIANASINALKLKR